MDRWIGKVAIVTGASSGIGASITEKLVEAGLQVVGLARRVERVEEIANNLRGRKGFLFAVKADVTQESDILDAFKWTTEKLGPISILINNAGVLRGKGLMATTTEDFKQILDTNVLGLCIATREAIKNMKANNIDGHIVHINSIAGHYVPQRFENLVVYPGSKYAVTAITETLRQELSSCGSKIKVTSISPGLTKTELADGGNEDLPEEIREKIAKMAILHPDDVADAVLYTLSTSPNVHVQELMIRPTGELL